LVVQKRPNSLVIEMESHSEGCLLDRDALQLELRRLVFVLP
jgi:hypothetical protein